MRKHSGEAYWDITGGRIHRGGTVEETLKREILEETGIDTIKSIKPLAMVLSNIRIPTDNSDTGLILGVYTCQVELPIQVTISPEHTEYGWFDRQQAKELLQVKYPPEFIDIL